MNEIELKRIELEINNLFQVRSSFINITVLLVGSSISLALTGFSFIKCNLSLVGFILSIISALVVDNCNKRIYFKTRSIK